MDNLQTASFKAYLDNFKWTTTSLKSIQNKITELIYYAELNEKLEKQKTSETKQKWIDQLITLDTNQKFTNHINQTLITIFYRQSESKIKIKCNKWNYSFFYDQYSEYIIQIIIDASYTGDRFQLVPTTYARDKKIILNYLEDKEKKNNEYIECIEYGIFLWKWYEPQKINFE